MSGTELITAERSRQIEEEGYTREHDRDHGEQLLAAAMDYVAYVYSLDYFGVAGTEEELPVPWPKGWPFKPEDQVRTLVKAGALIAAAIDSMLDEQGEDNVAIL